MAIFSHTLDEGTAGTLPAVDVIATAVKSSGDLLRLVRRLRAISHRPLDALR